jgi:hypothetical protein
MKQFGIDILLEQNSRLAARLDVLKERLRVEVDEKAKLQEWGGLVGAVLGAAGTAVARCTRPLLEKVGPEGLDPEERDQLLGIGSTIRRLL